MPYSEKVVAYAAAKGFSPADLPLIINGCSGGLSRFYALMGREISCEDCCNFHDIDYTAGGSSRERRQADKRLRQCAARAGSFTGWRAPFRRAWRCLRAWAMWLAVRLFGGRHWG